MFPSSAGNLGVETVAGGLVHPWSLAFLPDGRMLVTERPGRMRIVTRGGKLSRPIAGLPKVYARKPGRADGRDPDARLRQKPQIYLLLRRAHRAAAAASPSRMPG